MKGTTCEVKWNTSILDTCEAVLFSEVFSEVENLEYMYKRVVYTWGREKVLSRDVT